MRPDEEEEKNTRPSGASPIKPVHPLSGHQIWIEGNREAPAIPYYIKIHDLTTGKQIMNCNRVDMILEAGDGQIKAHLTLHNGRLNPTTNDLETEVVTVIDPMVSLKATVGEVGIDDSKKG